MAKSDKKRRASELDPSASTEPASAAAPIVASDPSILPAGTALDAAGIDEQPKKKAKKDKEEKKKAKKEKEKAAAAGVVDEDAGDAAAAKASKKDKDDAYGLVDMDALSPIAHPLADKKTGKKVLRTVKKGAATALRTRSS